jgi:hypothetical protein
MTACNTGAANFDAIPSGPGSGGNPMMFSCLMDEVLNEHP